MHHAEILKMSRTCTHCGSSYFSDNNLRRYCSKTCSRYAYKYRKTGLHRTARYPGVKRTLAEATQGFAELLLEDTDPAPVAATALSSDVPVSPQAIFVLYMRNGNRLESYEPLNETHFQLLLK